MDFIFSGVAGLQFLALLGVWIPRLDFGNFVLISVLEYISSWLLLAFACYAKSFANAFFFSSFSFLDRPSKAFFVNVSYFVTQESCGQDQTHFIGHIKKGLRKVFQDVTWESCEPCQAMCFFWSTVTSMYSIQKITKIWNSKTLNKMEGTQKIQLFKAKKNKEIELISRKVFKRRNWVIRNVRVALKSSTNTVAEKLLSSENISSWKN